MGNEAKAAIATLAGFLALGPLASSSAGALDPSSQDPVAIMREVSEPKGADTALSRMKMTIRHGANTRERLMSVRNKRGGEARKTLILIEQPADVRNTGFLTVDYRARGQADEQWLYLPGLHRVSRVPSSGKSDPFVGSDFSISDLSGPDPDEFEFKLLEQSVKVGDDDCWLIEAVPRNERVKSETGYLKSHTWVSKTKQIAVQIKAWTLSEGKTKYFKASDIRQVDGVWTPYRLQMRTLQQTAVTSETVIDVLSVKNNAAEVSDADFTQQRLERGV